MDMANHGMTVFSNSDNSVEKLSDSLSGARHCRNYRHSDHLAQFLVVERYSFLFELIEHIERDNHRPVHVDQLCGQIEIALEICGIDNIDDDIGLVIAQIFADI